MGTDYVHKPKALERQSGRLEKILAERDLEIGAMKEITAKMLGVQTRLKQVQYAIRRGITQR